MDDLIRAIREVSHVYSLLIRVEPERSRVVIAFPDGAIVRCEGRTTASAFNAAIDSLSSL